MRADTGLWGYTIIEVMIFLAVSGVMFLLAAAFISGKQATAEFKQGMNEINTQIEQTINDVNNGFYPSNSNFSCSSSIGSLSIASSTYTEQGTNGGIQPTGNGCIFLGKVIQFGDGSNTSAYNIYTVAGSQYQNGGSPPTLPTDFAEALPKAIDSSDTIDNVNLTQNNMFPWGLSATKVYENTGASNPPELDAIGFFSSFGSYNSDNSLVAGAQSTIVVAYTGKVSGLSAKDEPTMVTTINSLTSYATENILANPDIVVCLNGGSGQYGTLTIGGTNGQRLTTSINISSVQTPDCQTL